MSIADTSLNLEPLLEKARIYFRDKQYAECKACAAEIMDKYGDDISAEAEALTLKGACCFFDREYDEAECLLRRAIELEPSNPLSFQYLGQVLENNENLSSEEREKEAFRCYQWAFGLEPENAACCTLLGRFYLRYNDTENAIFYSGRALEIMSRKRDLSSDTDFAMQQAEYGAALGLGERFEEAEACFLSSVETAPNSLSYFMLTVIYTPKDNCKAHAYLEKLREIAATPDDISRIRKAESFLRTMETADDDPDDDGGAPPPPVLQ